MTEPKKAFRINVTGRVQGVGFRYMTQRKASRLGLTGWVRNERDGSVEICCEGNAAPVDDFILWLESGGPSYARIFSINKYPVNPTGTFSRFSVDY